MVRKKQLETFALAARMLKAVAHPVRIEIVDCLNKSKRLSVGELQARLNITQSMTSQHLASLKNVGVLNCEKQANVCYYSIRNKNVLKLINCVERCAKEHNS